MKRKTFVVKCIRKRQQEMQHFAVALFLLIVVCEDQKRCASVKKGTPNFESLNCLTHEKAVLFFAKVVPMNDRLDHLVRQC